MRHHTDVSDTTATAMWCRRRATGSKKGLQIAAVVGVLVAIGAVVYTTFIRADDADISAEKIHFVCPACGKGFDRTVAQVGVYARTEPCPACGKAADRAAQCPKCRKWDASKLAPGAKWVCPNCKYDPDPEAPSGVAPEATGTAPSDGTSAPPPPLNPRQRKP
jgi:predicted RNA-binding Zn-ribbon protein involved in translation (DUF1610 family)